MPNTFVTGIKRMMGARTRMIVFVASYPWPRNTGTNSGMIEMIPNIIATAVPVIAHSDMPISR